MTYFLDFDRTIFDTDAFNQTLPEHPMLSHLREELKIVTAPRDKTIKGGAGRTEMWAKLNELCKEGKLTFAPGELARFVFPDVQEFLTHHGAGSVVLTYGDPEWIRAKLESAFFGLPTERIIYANDKEKGIVLKPLLKEFSSPYLFVDDLAAQLDSVKEHCPEVALYEMRRDGKEPSGRYTVVHSLSEIEWSF